MPNEKENSIKSQCEYLVELAKNDQIMPEVRTLSSEEISEKWPEALIGYLEDCAIYTMTTLYF